MDREIIIKIKCVPNFLPFFMQTLYKNKFVINNLKLLSSEKFDIFEITLKYSPLLSKNYLKKILDSYLDKFKILEINDNFNDYAQKGLIEISPTEDLLEFSTENLSSFCDFRKNILTKLEKKEIIKKTGFAQSIAFINSFEDKKNLEFEELGISYNQLEEDILFLKKISGDNGFPLLFRYSKAEDFIHFFNSLDFSFSAFRLGYLDDEKDLSFYEQLYGCDLKLLSWNWDELPFIILTTLLRLKSVGINSSEKPDIGFIGITSSIMRSALLLKEAGWRKVWATDSKDACMHYFERAGGTASSQEHILAEAEIIIICKDLLTEEELESFDKTKTVISFLPDNQKINALSGQVKKLICGNWWQNARYYPYLLKCLLMSEKSFLSNQELLKIAKSLVSISGDVLPFPSVECEKAFLKHF